MPRIVWSPESIADLDGIRDYIARDSEAYADAFVQKILATVRSLPEFPESGRLVPEVRNARYREKIVGNYRIVYRTEGGDIHVVTIWHGARLLKLPEE